FRADRHRVLCADCLGSSHVECVQRDNDSLKLSGAPQEPSVPRSNEKPPLDEELQRAFAFIHLQPPQPNSLCERELQIGHLKLLELNAIQCLDVHTFHIASRIECMIRSACDNSVAVELRTREFHGDSIAGRLGSMFCDER